LRGSCLTFSISEFSTNAKPPVSRISQRVTWTRIIFIESTLEGGNQWVTAYILPPVHVISVLRDVLLGWLKLRLTAVFRDWPLLADGFRT